MKSSEVKRIYDNRILVAKECSKCHEIKSVNEFHKKKVVKKDGLDSKCKQCEKKYRKDNEERIKEYKRQYAKEYYENNKEKVKQTKKKYWKKWYENNKEKIRQYDKQRYENNKERIKQINKLYRDNNSQNHIKEIYNNITKKIYPHSEVQYGVIYGVRNTVTDRWYIGQTVNSFDMRYQGGFFKRKFNDFKNISSSLLKEDLDKYGEESFEIYKVIDIAFSEEELDALEVYYIDKYKAYDNGYNSNRGFVNGKRSYR